MEAYQTEEEQIEALKRWWEEYGRSVVFGVGMCLVLVFGWRAWQDHARQNAEAASAAYDQVQQAVQKASAQGATDLDRSTLETLAEPLLSEWSDSTYADLSRLLMAKAAVNGKELEKARDLLTTVAEQSQDEAIMHAAKQRLARVLLSLGEHDAALAQLKGADTAGSVYSAAYAEIRGDVLAAKGDIEGAKSAYERAVSAENNPRPFAEMKLNNLK